MYRVITWDSHDHPDMDAVVTAIFEVIGQEGYATGAYADTHSDFYAYVISSREIDEVEATRIFEETWLTTAAGVGEVYD